MKYLLVLAILFLSGCGDINFSTTSSGGNASEPEVIQPVIVEVSK